MSIKDIPFGSNEKFNVVVETPKDSSNKYEYDEKTDSIFLEWVFTDHFGFPFNYGFIPETIAGDGDTLDAFVLGDYPIAPGTSVECRAIGIIELLDRGEQDDKIITVFEGDPKYSKYKELEELPFDYKDLFEKFFAELGRQKNKVMEIKGFHNSQRTIEEIEKAKKDNG